MNTKRAILGMSSLVAAASIFFAGHHVYKESAIYNSESSSTKVAQETCHQHHLDGYYATSIDSFLDHYQRLPLDKSSTERVYNNERERIVGRVTGLNYQLVPIPISSHYAKNDFSNIDPIDTIVPGYIFARDKRTGEMVSLSNTIEVEAHTNENAPNDLLPGLKSGVSCDYIMA